MCIIHFVNINKLRNQSKQNNELIRLYLSLSVSLFDVMALIHIVVIRWHARTQMVLVTDFGYHIF